ncbi:MAG: PIN domain-containing protein [Verrucomicrobia bacterium]|nr:PIN domain-containing protein [Verrucomicrobiota bacterium]
MHLDPVETETTCLQLSKQYASEYLCRTLDIIHVATAILSGVKTFVTCDHRQAKLAREVGLHLHYIDLTKTASAQTP